MLPRATLAPERRVVHPACPRHPAIALDGGPAVFWCESGHGVPAADLDNEFRPTVAA
jgi:hypothetical protein